MHRPLALLLLVISTALRAVAAPSFPAVQVVPLPYQELAFEIGGNEVARYVASGDDPKPFLFPLIGPAGKRLTTMSHPVDPHGHRHHRSVWIGHRDVNGVNFWEEDKGGSIVMTRLESYGAEGESAWFRAAHAWRTPTGEVLLNEQRTVRLTALEKGTYYLDIRSRFVAETDVTFGQTPYGLLGVRVTPSMSVASGAGYLLNAEGDQQEAGVHGKQARWVDYAGPVSPDAVNGITYFDHPNNPGFPATWIVRDEGWMCASFSGNAPVSLNKGATLDVVYRLYIHGADESPQALEEHWKRFAKE